MLPLARISTWFHQCPGRYSLATIHYSSQGQGDNLLYGRGILLLEGTSEQLLGRTCHHRPAFLVHKIKTLHWSEMSQALV